jgi:SnoaL-like polyketide cyclase
LKGASTTGFSGDLCDMPTLKARASEFARRSPSVTSRPSIPAWSSTDLSDQTMEISMTANISETAKDVVRRNTEEVQGRGNWALFNELFADDFFDHTPQPGGTGDKTGVLALYKRLREAFPDFTPEIHWQRVDGDVVTTFKTYHGTHRGNFLGIARSRDVLPKINSNGRRARCALVCGRLAEFVLAQLSGAHDARRRATS